MKFTASQKRAIKRVCEDYDFDDTKEIREFLREQYGDCFDANWFTGDNEEFCYAELSKAVSLAY